MKFYNHNWTKFDRANWANSLQKRPKMRIFNGILPPKKHFLLRCFRSLIVCLDYSNSNGEEMNVVAPWARRKSLSRNPHRTLIHSMPQLRAVAMSTSLSPM